VADDPTDAGDPAPAPKASSEIHARRSLATRILFLACGLGITFYLASSGPREQHVRFVLGASAPSVEALDVEYQRLEDGEPLRNARLVFPSGSAPRVVAHDPELPDGVYRLRLQIDTREGRRAAERQVTLSGGTTSVDLAPALTQAP
jgi:hypothetical protein